MKTFKNLLVASTVLLTANFVSAQTWTQTSAPNTNWQSIASSADGIQLVAAAYGGGIYASTNSGATWLQTAAPSNRWAGVASSADGVKLVAVAGKLPTAGPIFTSSDSGTTWTQTGASNSYWSAVASSTDGTRLVAVSKGSANLTPIGLSADSGATWTYTNWFGMDWNSVASSTDGSILAAASGAASIYISTNSGVTWTKGGLKTYYSVNAAASSANGKNLVVGGNGLFTSKDYGATWNTNLALGYGYFPIASSADGTTLVAASATWLYHSTDSGTTWANTRLVTNGIISGIASSADGGKLAVAVNGGGIWTWQTTPAPVLDFTLLSNNLTLSWLVPSTNFVMQQSSDLSSWTDVTNTPVLNLTNL